MASQDKIEMTKEGRRAWSDYHEEGDMQLLLDWLETDDGQAYLSELRSRLPERVEVYRGLNGLVGDPRAYRYDIVGPWERALEDGDVPKYDGECRPIESWTDDRWIAREFAEGRIHIVEEPARFGVLLNRSVSRDEIIFHHEYVACSMRWEEECEVTIINE